MKTLKSLIAFVLSALILFPVNVLAFLKVQDQVKIIDKLNDLQLAGSFTGNNIVSFDSIQCQRSSRSCLLHLRLVDTSSEFGNIRHGVCLIEDVNSIYDILDEKHPTGGKFYSPLTKSFYQLVRNCHGVLESDDDDLMD